MNLRRKHNDGTVLCPIEAQREAYVKALPVIRDLVKHRGDMTGQEFRTLKGVALSGDTEGALKGLRKILDR